MSERIKPVATSRGLLGSTFFYLLDDRIEIGRLSVAFVEELERMSYRDVSTVTTWRTVTWNWLIVGALLVIAAIIVAGAFADFPSLVLAMVLFFPGVLFLFLGRKGSKIHVQIDDPYRSFKVPLGGFRSKQERVLADLISRIRDARSR